MIKIASTEDFDLVLKHCKDFSTTITLKDIVEEAKLKLLVASFLSTPKEEKIVLLHGEEGMLAAFIAPFLLGTAPVANEAAWWVIPSARKKNVGKELIEAYEFWAKKLNCKYTALSCYADNDIGKFYEAIGYTLHEKAYLKEMK